MTFRAALPAILLLAAPAVLGPACEAPGVSAGGANEIVHSSYDPDASDAANAPETGRDAGAAPETMGSPLCNASPTMTPCYPDDPDTATAALCHEAPDGGAWDPSGGNGDAQLGCHVEPAAGKPGFAPACTPAGSAVGGMECYKPTDCAAGYECIASHTCQHYCCSGDGSCSSAEFCDIQSTAGPQPVTVPVCMPIRPSNGCQLLKDGSCPDYETCAVVRDDGSTSCVAVGSARAGNSCDSEHCGRDLVCLGAPGERNCYQLCHTSTSSADSGSTTCAMNQSCKGGLPLFVDPNVGVCQ